MEKTESSKENNIVEREMYRFIDEIKELLTPKIWENLLLDCSKNEIFILWLLFRKRSVNMSQIAAYIHAPLNTATGIIARMEKKGLVNRERSEEDKRIVTIRFGQQGEEQMQSMLKELVYYGSRVMTAFTAEEMDIFFRMVNKTIDIMKEEKDESERKPGIKKIVIE